MMAGPLTGLTVDEHNSETVARLMVTRKKEKGTGKGVTRALGTALSKELRHPLREEKRRASPSCIKMVTRTESSTRQRA